MSNQQSLSEELAARQFKALGDPVRLRLYQQISRSNEVCVCELLGVAKLSAPTMSHHLKALRTAGLIEGDRRGTWIYYRAISNAAAQLADLLGAQVPV